MFYLGLMIIVAVLFLVFCLLIFIVGGGFTNDVKGGPVIRARKRAGIVRIPE